MDLCAPPIPDRFEALWAQYSQRLLAFLRSRVSDEAEAEDLLQEVFLRIHLNLCGLRDYSRLESWVFQIARNAIIDHYRSRRDLVQIPEMLPAEEPEEEDVEAELAPSLKEIVDELPAPYRQALVLTEYEGLSQVEMASCLGISISGAKSRVQRARRMIRDILLACCHFELDHYGTVIGYQERCCCCNPAH